MPDEQQTMWAVHVQGPDDVMAAPDKEVADAVCVVLNAQFKRHTRPGDPILRAVVIEWPYGYETWSAEKDRLHLEVKTVAELLSAPRRPEDDEAFDAEDQDWKRRAKSAEGELRKLYKADAQETPHA